jgi:nucleoid-associated protein YgaU
MRAFPILALLLGLCLPGLASAQNLHNRLADAGRAAQVRTALSQDDELRQFDFDASVRAGALTLTGVVRTQAQRQRAEQIARSFVGAGLVDNQLTVSADAGLNLARRRSANLPPVATAAPPASWESDDGEDSTPQVSTPRVQEPPRPRAEPQRVAPRAEPESRQVHHTVRRGETLSAIARQHGVSVDQIRRLNNIRRDHIQVGQRLRVK